MTTREFVRKMKAERNSRGVQTNACDVRALAILHPGLAEWAMRERGLWPFKSTKQHARKGGKGENVTTVCEACGKNLSAEEIAVNRKQTADAGEPVAWLCEEHRPVWRLWLSIEKEDRVTGAFGEAEQVENYLGKYDTFEEAEDMALALERKFS